MSELSTPGEEWKDLKMEKSGVKGTVERSEEKDEHVPICYQRVFKEINQENMDRNAELYGRRRER